MITIRFEDRPNEIRALAFMMGRYSARVLRGGHHQVPEHALEALTAERIAFVVVGRATYEQQLAALRSAASPSL